MSIQRTAHHLANHPDPDASAAWRAFATAQIDRRGIRPILDRVEAQIARNGLGKGAK